MSPALDRERRGRDVGKAVARGVHDVASGRHIGERDLADSVAGRLRDDDVGVHVHQLDDHRRDAQRLERHRRHHPAWPGGLLSSDKALDKQSDKQR